MIRRWLWLLLTLAIAGIGWALWRGTAEQPMDLAAPAGFAGGGRLLALHDDVRQCHALLERAGVRFTPLPARREGPQCGYADAVRLQPGGSDMIAWRPSSVGMACPVAAALLMWEWTVVQPAALKAFGTSVAAVEHYGSYACRRIYGRAAGNWSEHASAGAIDIAAFRLADGRRVSVAADWRSPGPMADFLRAVRTGACPLFSTVLSPDYNAAHRDHLHLDQARRGWGGRACR